MNRYDYYVATMQSAGDTLSPDEAKNIMARIDAEDDEVFRCLVCGQKLKTARIGIVYPYVPICGRGCAAVFSQKMEIAKSTLRCVSKIDFKMLEQMGQIVSLFYLLGETIADNTPSGIIEMDDGGES